MAQLWLSMDIKDTSVVQQLAYYQSILKYKIKGDWEDPTSFHITLDFLGDDETDFETVIQAMKLFDKYNTCKNQYIFGNKVNRFEQGVLWMGVDSSFKLYEARYQMGEYFKQVGYQKAPSKFAGYTPHITMAYNTPDAPIDLSMTRVPIPFDNITLWNSFKVNNEYIDNVLYSIKL